MNMASELDNYNNRAAFSAQEKKIASDFGNRLLELIEQEQRKYFHISICVECDKEISEDLNNRMWTDISDLLKDVDIEFKKIEMCCPRCDDRFLPHELTRPRLYDFPWYWKFEDTVAYCGSCNNEIVKSERDKLDLAIEESSKIETYPKSYKGKKVEEDLDHSSAKKGITSAFYRSWEEALYELRVRAALGGFDVVYGYVRNSRPCNDQNFIYSEWSITGNFAKKRIKNR